MKPLIKKIVILSIPIGLLFVIISNVLIGISYWMLAQFPLIPPDGTTAGQLAMTFAEGSFSVVFMLLYVLFGIGSTIAFGYLFFSQKISRNMVKNSIALTAVFWLFISFGLLVMGGYRIYDYHPLYVFYIRLVFDFLSYLFIGLCFLIIYKYQIIKLPHTA